MRLRRPGSSVQRRRSLPRAVAVAAAAAVAAPAVAAPSAGAAIPRGVAGLDTAEVRIVGEAGQSIGTTIGAGRAGDLDGDGYDDTVLPAIGDDERGRLAGAAYVFYGPLRQARLGVADADAKLLGELTGDFASEGWAGAGDLDGDGLDDLAVGAPGREPSLGQPGAPAPGAVYLFYGRRERLSGTLSLARADAKLVGATDVDFAGVAIASATDVDGDGLHDLVVGAPGDDEGGAQAGAVYVVRGSRRRLAGTVLLPEAGAKLVGAPGDLAGWGVAGAGRVDGDRYGDLLIAAPAYRDFGGDGDSSVYLHHPKRRLRGTVPLVRRTTRLVPERPDDLAYIGLAGGDLDGDGRSDVVVGASANDAAGTDAGAVYAFYGRRHRLPPTLPLDRADLELTGETAGDEAGGSIATADLDADGFADLTVGAPLHDAAGDRSGAVYVLFGERRRRYGRFGIAGADTKLLGEIPFSFAGSFVGGAGDVNGDGVEDLTVAGPAYSPDEASLDAGAMYVLHGGRPE